MDCHRPKDPGDGATAYPLASVLLSSARWRAWRRCLEDALYEIASMRLFARPSLEAACPDPSAPSLI
jgi:hypothetical protein